MRPRKPSPSTYGLRKKCKFDDSRGFYIVRFDSLEKRSGTVVFSQNAFYSVGHTSTGWNMNVFDLITEKEYEDSYCK